MYIKFAEEYIFILLFMNISDTNKGINLSFNLLIYYIVHVGNN